MRLSFAFIISSTLMTSAYAETPREIMNDPQNYSSFWSSSVEQGYSCDGEYGGTLKVVKFNKRISNFPRFMGAPNKTLDIGYMSSAANTLIVSEGYGTEISTVAGRSIFGNSEDTDELFSAGEFTHMKSHPDYRPNHNSDRTGIDRFLVGSPILLKGVILDKKTGKMQALFLQNQAEQGERFRYEPDYISFECNKIPNDDLFEFSSSVVGSLLDSMSQTRNRFKATVGVSTDQNKAVENNKIDKAKVSEGVNAPDKKVETNKKPQEDFGPVENLKNPEAYSKKAGNLVKFVLHCKNPKGAKMRVAMFEYPLTSFPYLKIDHNEDDLKAIKKYSFERLKVETSIRSVQVARSSKGKSYDTLVVFNGNTLGEIYPAGLSFYTSMTASETSYYSGRALQLREGRTLPKAFRPTEPKSKNGKQVPVHPLNDYFTLDLNEIVIDRHNLSTSIWLSARGASEYRETNSCTLSETPKEDVHSLIHEVFKGISEEKNRITKSGAKNKI